MTTLYKCYEESFTKNVLCILCLLCKQLLPVRVNGRVQQNGQILGHVQYSKIRAKVYTSLGVKKESTKSLSNKWKKTFHRDLFMLYWKLLCDFQISSQKRSFLTTLNVKNKFWSNI